MAAASRPSLRSLIHVKPASAKAEDLALAHSEDYIRHVMATVPSEGLNFLDLNTALSPESGDAALYAAGAVLHALDMVTENPGSNAFCAVRPPGHHAHRDQGGGFCMFNNLAIGVRAARRRNGLRKVAIVDFDVHHGDGTQNIVENDPDILFISLHQSPLFPGSGYADECGPHQNVLNIPLSSATRRAAYRRAVTREVIPKIQEFAPDIIFLSAGFDAHRDDPLGGLNLLEKDFAWLAATFCRLAGKLCEGRLIAVLEGGYDLVALENSVAAFLKAMLKGTAT